MTIHTRQLQQCTQDNYNNTHKTSTTIHTKHLQQYTQDNYNNTHKTTTTIHTRHLKIQHVQTVNSTKVRKYCIQFVVFFPTHIVLTLSPQPFISHHFTTHINFSHKVSFLPPSLHCTSLHFKYLKLSLKFFNHNLPLSILEHCDILPTVLKFSSTIVIKSLNHASRKTCQAMHVTDPSSTENMLWCYGFSNYDAANILVEWGRPVLVKRLRRTYAAHTQWARSHLTPTNTPP